MQTGLYKHLPPHRILILSFSMPYLIYARNTEGMSDKRENLREAHRAHLQNQYHNKERYLIQQSKRLPCTPT